LAITASEWVRKQFKGNKVWMATDGKGHPLIVKNKALIKYQLDQEYEYWVNPDHIHDIGTENPLKHKIAHRPLKNKNIVQYSTLLSVPEKISPNDAVIIYTDGASSGNPGPSGIGIIMEYGRHKREISKYIGDATNNIAELTAVHLALLELKRRDIPVKIYTDSNYVYRLLTSGWKAKKNIELVNSIRRLISQFSKLEIIKVKGHAGIDGNERADQLATGAIYKKNKKSPTDISGSF